MEDRIINDIFNNILSVNCLFKWLSKETTADEENIFLNQYKCNQVDFVSHFFYFLREQSSRYYQIYNAKTPRKNSHSRIIKNNSPAVEKSSPSSKPHHSSINLESLQSFPTLSSSSSILESDKKHYETSNDSFHDSSANDNSDKKLRKVKLFSETLEGNLKDNNLFKKELTFLEDEELKQISENKFAVSTPKTLKNNSLPGIECFNTSDLQLEISSKPGAKMKWRNQSLDLSPEAQVITPKSRSYTGGSSHRSKDNKMSSRISLGDFIHSDMNDNKKEKKTKAKKRINPTRVSSMSQISCSPSFSEKTGSSLESSKLDELQTSKESNEKVNCSSELLLDDIKDVTPVKNSTDSIEIQPTPELVTFTKELKILSEIYSFLINENYCQNVMIELCFVISLLVVEECNREAFVSYNLDSSLEEEKSFFGSIHNCVFFAVETLWLQRNLLLFLNLSDLRLLSENVRIEKFNRELKEFLVNAYCSKQSNEELRRRNRPITFPQGFVPFEYETDNRENFTSNFSFQSFRKQRDLFYDILTIWEANHLVSGWIFSIGLGFKIRSLLSICSDPINYLHLARLFREQLIMSCCGENQPEEEVNEEILQLFPSEDLNKILRLRARLTSSPKRQGPCPVPDFTGYQEFYKNFILCTTHSIFHEHLKNSLLNEILYLNGLTSDIEDEDSYFDYQIQERYLRRTNILRLLAKFLGFVEFLPYRGEKSCSDKVLSIHRSVKSNKLPLFDVLSCLNTAIKERKLILTIPWMVSYLSMIDPYSMHLNPYQAVWRLLILIYKHLKAFHNTKNGFYLKLTLGWLFHLLSFSSREFYSVIDEYNKNSTEVLGLLSEEEAGTGLDFRDIIEETILYTVCPFLNEINTILSENSGCAVKHIRPVTTQNNSSSKLQASKQLELRLESNFLHNQSLSTRKTVEFVTERVASIVIKHLIHNVIPKIKETAWAELKSSPITDLKEAEIECGALSEKCYQNLQVVCEKENWEIIRKRSDASLKALLSDDLQGSVADTCGKIVARQATEKVQRWMQSHITPAIMKEDFLSIMKKKIAKKPKESNNSGIADVSESELIKAPPYIDSHQLPTTGRGVVHDTNAWPASQTLKTVRELIWKISEEGCSAEEIKEVLEETLKTIKGRNDMIPAAEKTLLFLIVDLIVIFCVHSTSDVPQDLFKKFYEFLKCVNYQNYPQCSLGRIICPRNVALIRNNAKRKEKAWENLGNFLMGLMEEKLLSKEEVESQLLSLLQINWEKEGDQFSKFISQILQRYRKNNECDKFVLLLEYMIETFTEDESESKSID